MFHPSPEAAATPRSFLSIAPRRRPATVRGMKSMTGFGRGEATGAGGRCAVELSSVNRKQADVDLRMPRDWQALEAGVRQLLAGVLSRGKLHGVISNETATEATSTLRVDEALAKEYAAYLSQLGAVLGSPMVMTPEALLRAPGVFNVEDRGPIKPEVLQPMIFSAVSAALVAWDEARVREGAHLLADLTNRLHALRTLLEQIAVEAPRVGPLHRAALLRRLEEAGLPLQLDDERLLKEIALFADKCDINEEISRLGGHLIEFQRLMDSGTPAGRPLDFLTQEMHRELNTMGAKANHAPIQHLVVAGKTEVERLREQVQNVE